MEFFKITRNEELFMHSVTIEEAKNFFDKIAGKSCSSYLYADTSHGKYVATQDLMVDYYHDGVDDQYGWSWHTIIKDVDGNTLVDNIGGDWTATRPNANTVPARRVPAASVGL